MAPPFIAIATLGTMGQCASTPIALPLTIAMAEGTALSQISVHAVQAMLGSIAHPSPAKTFLNAQAMEHAWESTNATAVQGGMDQTVRNPSVFRHAAPLENVLVQILVNVCLDGWVLCAMFPGPAITIMHQHSASPCTWQMYHP